MELDVLYEDDALIAVNKPAGVVVHPTYKNVAGTLLDALRSSGLGDPAIVGRLDKHTSGIVIAAKSPARFADLQRILSSPPSRKEYIAVVRGSIEDERGTIALPLRVDPADRRRVIVSERDGRPSETRFERIAGDGQLTALRCLPVTGRRHQIRVHLAARGWPVLGDRVYGEALVGFPRHALHAHRTSFQHPVSGALVQIEAPLPDDICGVFSWLTRSLLGGSP